MGERPAKFSLELLPTTSAIDCAESTFCICLDEIEMDAELVELHCGHVLHFECAKQCYETCGSADVAKFPLCRQCPFPVRSSTTSDLHIQRTEHMAPDCNLRPGRYLKQDGRDCSVRLGRYFHD